MIFNLLFLEESDCKTPDGSDGVCVQIEECKSIQSVFENAPRPLPLNVTDFLNSFTCGFINDINTIAIVSVNLNTISLLCKI